MFMCYIYIYYRGFSFVLIVTFLSLTSFISIVWLSAALDSSFRFELSPLRSANDCSWGDLSIPIDVSFAPTLAGFCLVSCIELKGEAFICVLVFPFAMELTLGEDVLDAGCLFICEGVTFGEECAVLL